MTAPRGGRRADLALAGAGVAIGLAVALGYAAFRAISPAALQAGERWSRFGDAMLFPGALIVVAVAAMVWLGWKANID